MDLTPGQTAHGFTVVSHEQLPEIDGEAVVFTHEASKARLLYLKNDDNNKAFSIGFRTPPQDDTGVFHILEHSVLCGSDKYPVKEPFVDLLKSSMQTFLNAMTFPDKTMYPVASTNEHDLYNLMDVYLDAVLHPAIYRKRTVFEQEGWHYELTPKATGDGTALAGDAAEIAPALAAAGVTDPDAIAQAASAAGITDEAAVAALVEAVAAAGAAADDADAPNPADLPADQTRLVYNGVVFNEMKGALSESSSVLFDELQKALFPDGAYAFESGGTPEGIPTLSYENYLDEHRRHYRLDNSYALLYGNLDIDRALAYLDERFTPEAQVEAARDEERRAAGAEPLRPRTIDLQKPVRHLGVVHPMDTAPENACAGAGYVIGSAHDRERVMATDILVDALAGSNEAPLKRALLDADIADDVSFYLADSLAQPFVVAEMRLPRNDGENRLVPLISETVEHLLEGGLDRELIEASLSHAEFAMREHNFGTADGVVYAMASLAGWLYDDAYATAYLRYDKEFADLRAKLDGTYFDDLARSLFVDNDHMASASIVPEPGCDGTRAAEELAKKNESLTPEERHHIVDEEAELRAMQTEPDSPEAKATLPRLGIADIEDVPAEPHLELDWRTPLTCLRHRIPTRGIAYAYRYFDADRLSFEDLPYASILALVLGKLPTSSHTAAQIDTLVQGKLGNLDFYLDVYEDRDDVLVANPKFVVSASALSPNSPYLATLVNEVLYESDFSDTAKIRDVLAQRKIDLEQGFIAGGHSCAMARVRSYSTAAGVVREQVSNVDFYLFLRDLLEHFDERAGELSSRLASVAQTLFNDDLCTVSFTGTEDDYDAFWLAKPQTGRKLGRERSLVVPQPQVRNEAFIVPSNVCFASVGRDRRTLGTPYSGAHPILSRVLSFDYLWNEVRVKGGAYGVGFGSNLEGFMRFYSFRDPHLDETLERFAKAGDWIRQFDPSEKDWEGFVVSTVAGLDAPIKPRQLIRRQDAEFFARRPQGERAALRANVLKTSVDDVRALADTVDAVVDAHQVCAFGNEEILTSSKAGLNVVRLMG